MTDTKQDSGAVLSPCGSFRYRLWRNWDAEKPRLCWVMLNPSTADAEVDDPTIKVCMEFAKLRGFGGIEVVNLYAYRATDPAELRREQFPGADEVNDLAIWAVAHSVVEGGGRVVAAWGNHAKVDRATFVASKLLWLWHVPLYVLGFNKHGSPKHPLYVKRSTEFKEWIW